MRVWTLTKGGRGKRPLEWTIAVHEEGTPIMLTASQELAEFIVSACNAAERREAEDLDARACRLLGLHPEDDEQLEPGFHAPVSFIEGTPAPGVDKK